MGELEKQIESKDYHDYVFKDGKFIGAFHKQLIKDIRPVIINIGLNKIDKALTLAELSQQPKFRVVATRMLNSLSANYLAGNNSEGILKHGCYHKPENLGVDESLI